MSEQTESRIIAKEEVALNLARDIASREALHNDSSTYRKKILDLYAECLHAARGLCRYSDS